MFLPSVAVAQNCSEGVYVELRGGATFLTDSDFEDLGSFTDIELDIGTGWLVDAAVGSAHASGLRGELALGYRENGFDEIEADLGGIPLSADVDGDKPLGAAEITVVPLVSKTVAGGRAGRSGP